MRNLKRDIKKTKISINWSSASFITGLSLLITAVIQKNWTIEQLLGTLLVCIISIFIQYKDIQRYRPPYYKHKKMLILLGLILLGTLVFGRATEYLLLNFSRGIGFIPHDTIIYGVPIALGGMLIALLFDPHTAIMFSFTIALLCGIWQNDINYSFYIFVGSILAAFSVIRCKKRHDIVKAGLNISLANMVTVIIIELLSNRFYPMELLPSVAFAVVSGLSVSGIVSLILPFLEHYFKVTTDITLLEFVDLDHPLMKELMIQAPGTYHHSIIVGNLVDAASEEVGVNPLLARVSAYYHDIGKIKMPEYFVENQSTLVNKHDKLMPHLSCMVIISHVKDGLELAKEYNLPIPVRAAITEHHGTNLISYFYSKAKEGQAEAPSQADYRYPGPRPQTRITGLLMIADAVEAASRVLTEPTPSRVNGLIDKIVNQIFLDGQLDECELTLKDIHKIKDRFSYILTSILHKRIEYPGFDFNEKKKKDDTTTQKPNDTDKKSPAKDKAIPQSDKPMDESRSFDTKP